MRCTPSLLCPLTPPPTFSHVQTLSAASAVQLSMKQSRPLFQEADDELFRLCKRLSLGVEAPEAVSSRRSCVPIKLHLQKQAGARCGQLVSPRSTAGVSTLGLPRATLEELPSWATHNVHSHERQTADELKKEEVAKKSVLRICVGPQVGHTCSAVYAEQLHSWGSFHTGIISPRVFTKPMLILSSGTTD